jgi:hypothetical protein
MDKQGIKNDLGKLRWDLLPIECLKEVVEIYTFGSKKYDEKYGEENWKKVDNPKRRYYAALHRHLSEWWLYTSSDGKLGEGVDKESGKSHIFHVIWNALALGWFELMDHK